MPRVMVNANAATNARRSTNDRKLVNRINTGAREGRWKDKVEVTPASGFIRLLAFVRVLRVPSGNGTVAIAITDALDPKDSV